MLTEQHKLIAGKIWEIANRLRGPYRPPQYRLVMLPMVVLRRLDCVLEPTKEAVLREHERLRAAGTAENAVPRLLTRVVNKGRKHDLYNTSPYTFQKLLGDSENIAPNLVSYINGFSDTARKIFEKFKFGDQIEKLDASNRLYNIVKAMADVDLHPDKISNIEMGYVFEHLVMRFNEQANEEAGDHFTPREVIRLMTSLVYTGEEDVYKPGVYREIYDPACGTGGMLSVSEEFIVKGQNRRANLGLYGQEYNDESWAICCSDMLIKDEETNDQMSVHGSAPSPAGRLGVILDYGHSDVGSTTEHCVAQEVSTLEEGMNLLAEKREAILQEFLAEIEINGRKVSLTWSPWPSVKLLVMSCPRSSVDCFDGSPKISRMQAPAALSCEPVGVALQAR